MKTLLHKCEMNNEDKRKNSREIYCSAMVKTHEKSYYANGKTDIGLFEGKGRNMKREGRKIWREQDIPPLLQVSITWVGSLKVGNNY